jgi:hypothetical protein
LRLQRRRQTGRAGADDDHVVDRWVIRGPLREILDGLAPLSHRVADEPHATELAGDVDALGVGLERLAHQGNVDPSGGGAEDQRDRVDGARRGAGAVADTLGRVDQFRAAVDDTEDLTLGARRHARADGDAAVGVEAGVQGHRLADARRRVLLQTATRTGSRTPLTGEV